MANESDILVRVGANVAPLTVGLKKAKRELGGFRGTVNQGAKDLTKYSAAGIAAGAALGTHFVKGALDAIDSQAKLAKSIRSTSSEVATMTRAGELAGVSLQQISNAALKLELNAGKAEIGLAAQARAFDALGLSAAKVSSLPLTEQLITVNQALRENVAETERAAIAADIFGAKNAAVIRLLDPDTIKQAAEEMEVFGLNLSEIDASKVEMANDAMSRIGKGIEGISQQAAIELAPILKALGDLFFDVAKEGGGVGEQVRESFNTAIKAAGFVADAMAGVKRVGMVVFSALEAGILGWARVTAATVEKVLKVADLIPAVDLSQQISQVQTLGETLEDRIIGAKERVDAALLEPLPSESFNQFIEQARAAGEEAAKAAVEAREAVAMPEGLEPQSTSAKDAEAAKNERLQQLIDGFEQERVLTEEHNQMMADLELAYKNGMISSEDELRNYEQQAEIEHMNKLMEIRAQGYQGIQGLVESHNGAIAASTVGALQSILGTMATHNKKAFKLNKQLALADAAISTYQGIAAGVKLGWPLAIPAVAWAAANGFAQIQQIKSQTFGGTSASSRATANGQVSTVPQVQEQNQGGGGGAGAQTLNVRGIGANDLFTGEQLVGIINEAQANGAQLRVADQ